MCSNACAGRQHSVLWPEEPRGLTTNLTLLPEQLRRLGYDTRMLGKWHLGFCNQSYLPTRCRLASQLLGTVRYNFC